jgi:tetratricopeptide (TPR) repeat protein
LKPSIPLIVIGLGLAEGLAIGQKPSPAIASKAQLDFEKVDAAPIPTLADTMSCMQSNAAALAAARVEERYLAYYRKGYCELFGALVTKDSDTFQAAAKDFTEAIANWPKKPVSVPPAGLRALAAISKLEQGRMADSYPDTLRDLESIAKDPSCPPSPIMSMSFCAALVDTARAWQGWFAWRKNEFDRAAEVLQPIPGSVLTVWISGRLAQDRKRLDEAASLYEKVLQALAAAEKSPNPDVLTLLGPTIELDAVHYQAGLLEYSRQRYDAAISHFDISLKISPKNSYAIFLRARSKEALHLSQPALADYALAAQTARANNDSSWSVGQAYYQRGLLFFQAKDYNRAETEFATALGARLTETTPDDVTAWRVMTAVAGGACKSIDTLEAAVKAASSDFPKTQAELLVFDCRTMQATTLDQLMAIEKVYAGRLDSSKLRTLRDRIASEYANQGLAAEDRKDPYSAVIAYRKAIEWNPNSAKARFNLGAIYIDDKRYELAEKEYRALVEADGDDFEARYWLGQSILAQRPAPERVIEACGLLRRSLAVNDPEKKAEFAKGIVAAKCPN